MNMLRQPLSRQSIRRLSITIIPSSQVPTLRERRHLKNPKLKQGKDSIIQLDEQGNEIQVEITKEDKFHALINQIRDKTKEADYELVPQDDNNYDVSTIKGHAKELTRERRNNMTIRELESYQKMAKMDQLRWSAENLIPLYTENPEFIGWKKWTKYCDILIYGSLGFLVLTYAYVFYREYISEELFEYYNKEYMKSPFMINEKPDSNFTEMVMNKVVKPMGYSVENSKILYRYCPLERQYHFMKDGGLVTVFHNKETNGLTIYVPHYFTKNLSLGDYLNNCEKYESLFFGQKINNELWSNENLQNHFVLSKHLANRIPSDNQMNLTIAKAIISKYGYISKVNKEAKNDVEVDRRSGYDKKSGKIVMSHDPNKVEFAYQKYTSPADIKPLSVFQNLPQKDWQMLAIPLGLFAVGKIAKPVAKPLIENPIKKRGFRFLRNAFLIGPIATYLSFLAFKLSLRFKETEIEDHLRKSNIDHCKAIYEDHEKARRLYNVYCNLEGFEHLKNNKFYDGDGNFLITYFLVEQWLKMYMNNYTETLPSVRRQEAKDLIQLCYRQELPYIADQFRDEDELTW